MGVAGKTKTPGLALRERPAAALCGIWRQCGLWPNRSSGSGFLAGRTHSFIDLIVLLENDLNTVMPEWT